MAIRSGHELLREPQDLRGSGGFMAAIILLLTLGGAVVVATYAELSIEAEKEAILHRLRKSIFE